MLRRAVIPIAVLAILAPPLAAMARPATPPVRVVTARSGGVTASLRYAGQAPQYSHQTLTITAPGQITYHEPVTSKYCGHECGPSITPSQRPVQVVDLNDDGETEVLLNLYTGGAHCCYVVQVFAPSAAIGGYVMTAEHDFGDPGYRLEDPLHNGQHDFITGNDAFAYEFTDFAASGLPLQILQYDPDYGPGAFADVTAAYPARVRRDAASWLRAYHAQAQSHWSDSVGVIAAWAADEYTLGRSKQALRFLDAQAKAGHLNSPLSPEEPGGLRFVAKLRRFLHTQGYLG